MNKEVTKKRMREILAIILSALMIAGIFSCFSVLADDSTEENVEESSCVILRAEDLIGKLYIPNDTVAELGERDGISVVDLTVSINDPNDPERNAANDVFVHVDLNGYVATKYIAILTYAEINAFTNCSIYYHTSARGDAEMGLGEDAREASPYALGTGWQFLEYDMSSESGWGGDIYTFRLDYLEGDWFSAGTECQIAAIILSDDGKALQSAAYELMTEIYTPVQTLSDFKEPDVEHFNLGAINTQVNANEGSLIYSYVENGQGNDPQAMFDYLGYVGTNGMQALTTDDFRYTVIRYRTPTISRSVMELFTLTGSAESLMDMIRIEGQYTCHSASASYSYADSWSAMALDMAEDDGLEENTGLKYGWYREDGDRTFKGFRVDWCSGGAAGDYLEISDIMFYQDKDAANGMAFALSSLIVGDDFYWGGDSDESDDTLGDDILPPWETEETTTEETIPAYDNTEEETTEAPSEETSSEENTEEITTEETAPDESNDESRPEITIDSDGIGGSDDEPKEKGSEVPFYIACGLLAALSVVSVATVITIRIRERR